MIERAARPLTYLLSKCSLVEELRGIDDCDKIVERLGEGRFARVVKGKEIYWILPYEGKILILGENPIERSFSILDSLPEVGEATIEIREIPRALWDSIWRYCRNLSNYSIIIEKAGEERRREFREPETGSEGIEKLRKEPRETSYSPGRLDPRTLIYLLSKRPHEFVDRRALIDIISRGLNVAINLVNFPYSIWLFFVDGKLGYALVEDLQRKAILEDLDERLILELMERSRSARIVGLEDEDLEAIVALPRAYLDLHSFLLREEGGERVAEKKGSMEDRSLGEFSIRISAPRIAIAGEPASIRLDLEGRGECRLRIQIKGEKGVVFSRDRDISISGKRSIEILQVLDEGSYEVMAELRNEAGKILARNIERLRAIKLGPLMVSPSRYLPSNADVDLSVFLNLGRSSEDLSFRMLIEIEHDGSIILRKSFSTPRASIRLKTPERGDILLRARIEIDGFERIYEERFSIVESTLELDIENLDRFSRGLSDTLVLVLRARESECLSALARISLERGNERVVDVSRLVTINRIGCKIPVRVPLEAFGDFRLRVIAETDGLKLLDRSIDLRRENPARYLAEGFKSFKKSRRKRRFLGVRG